MSTRGTHRRRLTRALGITILILGMARVPLPRADYHNVRHHDGAGQACPMHDHLLHWHPGASRAADIAILHWHWVAPLGDTDDDESGSRPVVKPLGCDGLASGWEDGPRAFADESSAPAVLAVAPPTLAIDSVFLFHGPTLLGVQPRARPGPSRAFSATFTPHVSLSALLSRWTC